jgi:hypothetical protein
MAALSAAAASSLPAAETSTRLGPQSVPYPLPFEADIADPGYMAHVADEKMDLFVSLEEAEPADPGELSGAKLWIHERGAGTYVSAGIGDTLQPMGYRSSHWLGWLDASKTAALALAAGRGFSVPFAEARRPRWQSIWLHFSPGENSELNLEISGHSLGVLRGEPLARFLDCIRKRRALKIAA